MGTGTLVLFLTLGMAVGQNDVYTLHERNIQIPIVVRPEKRGELKELLLFVSTDQGKTWNLAAPPAKPDDPAFPFPAPADGQYWFKVCAVNVANQREPADIYSAPVNMKVAIDSQRQLLRIVSAERFGDDIRVAWETFSPQLELLTMKMEYRTADQGPNTPWQPVPMTPAASGQTQFRPQSNGPLAIKMQVNDTAGTPAFAVKELPAAAPSNPTLTSVANSSPQINPMAAPATPVVQQTNSISAPMPPAAGVPLMQGPATANAPAPTFPHEVTATAPAAAPPVVPPPAPAPTMPAAPAEQVYAPVRAGMTALPSSRPSDLAPLVPPTQPANGMPLSAGAPTPPSRPDQQIQHVRDSQVALDFELDRTGPSGVKKIEVYITQDDGRTWYRWMETPEVKSPLQLPLPPHERTFGFKLVPYSGVLQSIGAPQAGDEPDIRLHVDRTPPRVEWYPLEPDASLPNAVSLRYLATDINLAPNGVALAWATHPRGPWQPIQANNRRPKEGYSDIQECTWMLPPDLPNQVYLKVSARDLAGNVAESITRDPQTLDLHKPTARVKGIVTARPSQPAPPAAIAPLPFGSGPGGN